MLEKKSLSRTILFLLPKINMHCENLNVILFSYVNGFKPFARKVVMFNLVIAMIANILIMLKVLC